MIQNVKRGIKLMPYAYGLVSNMVCCGIMFLVGIIMEMMKSRNYFMIPAGALFMAMPPVFLSQLLITLFVPEYVTASPYGKKFKTSVFCAINTICYLLLYAVVVLIELLKSTRESMPEGQLAVRLIAVAGFVVLVEVYQIMATRYMMASTILYALLCAIGGGIYGFLLAAGKVLEAPVPIPAALLLGIGLILLGGLLQYGLSLLLYKKPMSKYCQTNSLRKKL